MEQTMLVKPQGIQTDPRAKPASSGYGQIRNIFVPVSGSETDREVISMAFAVAQSLQAHLEFLHLRLSLAQAAVNAPHVDFCLGQGLRDSLDHLQRQQSNLSVSAIHYVQQFCSEHAIELLTEPRFADTMTASCIEEADQSADRLLFHARHCDLTILGRAQHHDCMPRTLIDDLLVGSGRPLLLVPHKAGHDLLDTVVVGWKETANAARALAAALPLLRRARRVVLVNIAEDNGTGPAALDHMSRQLAWHGIQAEVRRFGDGIAPAAELLPRIASDLKAGLLVVGGFGHSQMRETIFGGVTRTLLDGAQLAIFIMH
jgi:nucleotide-binding universal stress UspA family protein